MISVLLADDHPMVRQGLRALLEETGDFEVVAEAGSGAEAVAQTAATAPQVVVMDLQMPDGNGIEATRQIMSSQPEVAVLVLTMFEDDASVFAAMRAGARGYLLKGADRTEVLRSITAVAHGEAIFGPGIAQRVLAAFAVARDGRAQQPFPQLTEREHEILDLLARGLDNAAIAGELYLSAKTVANHVSNILAKLHLADRAQAIVRGREAGLGRRPEAPPA